MIVTTTTESAAKPRLLSLFNVVSGLILAVGLYLVVLRFTKGLGATTNLDHLTPWGLWVGFKLAAIALAGGAFSISTAVYLFRWKRYMPVVRPAILTGFLGYLVFLLSLVLDLGQPWRLHIPFLVQAGFTSTMFEIAVCVASYFTVLALELSPTALEWRGWRRLRMRIYSLVVPMTALGLILSTLHQSALGGLYLSMPTRLHPLWWSPLIPLHFFVSAIAAGLSMAILENALVRRFFAAQVEIDQKEENRLTRGLARANVITLVAYCLIKVTELLQGQEGVFLVSRLGLLYAVELFALGAVPCVLFLRGLRTRRIGTIRVAAILTVIGIVLNRVNISMVAFNFHIPAHERYVPNWIELWVALSLFTLAVVIFRFTARRMPVLYKHPKFREII